METNQSPAWENQPWCLLLLGLALLRRPEETYYKEEANDEAPVYP